MRPTGDQIAAHFEISQTTVSGMIAEFDAAGSIPGEPRGRRTSDLSDKVVAVLKFVSGYMAEHTWAPSRREIATGVGLPLALVNKLVAVLASQQMIEVGHESRQIRMTTKGKRKANR